VEQLEVAEPLVVQAESQVVESLASAASLVEELLSSELTARQISCHVEHRSADDWSEMAWVPPVQAQVE